MKLFDRVMTSMVQAFLRTEKSRLGCSAVFYQPERPVYSRSLQDDKTRYIEQKK